MKLEPSMVPKANIHVILCLVSVPSSVPLLSLISIVLRTTTILTLGLGEIVVDRLRLYMRIAEMTHAHSKVSAAAGD
jgi:hypothetical protein